MNPKPFLFFLVLQLAFIGLLKAQDDLDLLFTNCKYQQVIQQTDSLLKTDSTHFETWYYRALAQTALYRFQPALSSYGHALCYTTDSATLLYQMAQMHENMSNRKEAFALYEQIYQIDSNYIPAKARLAAIYTTRQNYLKAIGLYSSLIKNDSTNSYFYSRLAYNCWQIGILQAAVNYYYKALELNNADMVSAADVVEMFIKVKQFETADSIADSLLVLQPGNIELMKKKACISSILGNYDESTDLFKKVLQMGDSTSFTLKNFGNTLYNNGHFAESLIWLRRYEVKNPDDTENLFTMALACQKDYRYEEALNLFDSVLMQIYDKNVIAGTFAERAKTYQMYGDFVSYRDSTKTQAGPIFQLALDDYNQSLQLNNKQFQVCLQLANLYETRFKDNEKALKYYQVCLKSLPENQEPLDHKEWLTQKINHLKEEQHFK